MLAVHCATKSDTLSSYMPKTKGWAPQGGAGVHPPTHTHTLLARPAGEGDWGARLCPTYHSSTNLPGSPVSGSCLAEAQSQAQLSSPQSEDKHPWALERLSPLPGAQGQGRLTCQQRKLNVSQKTVNAICQQGVRAC